MTGEPRGQEKVRTGEPRIQGKRGDRVGETGYAMNNTLDQDIKSRQFRPVYLIYGEETYLKTNYKNRLKTAITGDDTMNFHYFEGKGQDLNEIIGLADTMPFFGEKRLILMEDSGFFKGNAAAPLAEYLPRMPDTTCMVFVESQVDGRNRLYKLVKEIGCAAEMERQSEERLAEWAARILMRAGKRITGRTMKLFLSKTGDDMENIRMELEKLIGYTGDRDVVSDKDVEAICTVPVTDEIFKMISAVSGGQTNTALDLYKDLLALKEPPMRILNLIGQQFHCLLQIKELLGRGESTGNISSRLKLRPSVVRRMTDAAGTFSREQLLSYVRLCVETEEAVKTGRLNDQLAVELLITKNYQKDVRTKNPSRR